MRERRLPSKQESRIQWWRRLIVRQQSATVPLAEFCRQVGINTRKFYYWRQRLREMDGASGACQVSSSGSPRPAGAMAQKTAASFVPVSIVNPGTATQLEIELANGCALRLTGEIDPGLLQAAISAAGQLDGPGWRDH
jgi:transposase-like protein